jgi:hypothetical protein
MYAFQSPLFGDRPATEAYNSRKRSYPHSRRPADQIVIEAPTRREQKKGQTDARLSSIPASTLTTDWAGAVVRINGRIDRTPVSDPPATMTRTKRVSQTLYTRSDHARRTRLASCPERRAPRRLDTAASGVVGRCCAANVVAIHDARRDSALRLDGDRGREPAKPSQRSPSD